MGAAAADLDAATVLAAVTGRGFTGADLYALCADASLQAIRRLVEADGSSNADVTSKLRVTLADFEAALATLRPSVTPEEMARYQSLHRQLVGAK
jgi:SpoVK/Ycf46/Vps4 family AAA+-type ATPase